MKNSLSMDAESIFIQQKISRNFNINQNTKVKEKVRLEKEHDRG